MKSGIAALAVASVLVAGGCSDPQPEADEPEIAVNVSAPGNDRGAALGPVTASSASRDGAAAKAVEITLGECSKVEQSVSAKPAGIIKMGEFASQALYGKAGELVCSEPNATGVGECELAANSAALVSAPAGAFTLEAGERPTRIWYGPRGISCSKAEVG